MQCTDRLKWKSVKLTSVLNWQTDSLTLNHLAIEESNHSFLQKGSQFSSAFGESVASQWECLLDFVSGCNSLVVNFILLPGNASGTLVFFCPACISVFGCRVCFFWSSLMSVFDRPFHFFFNVISASKQFAEEALKAHNDYRKKHGVPPLKLCKKLNRGAQLWVQSFFSLMRFVTLWSVRFDCVYCKNICLLTRCYPMKTCWVESEGLYSFVPSFSVT